VEPGRGGPDRGTERATACEANAALRGEPQHPASAGFFITQSVGLLKKWAIYFTIGLGYNVAFPGSPTRSRPM
jgi:hypothetical protein